MQPVGQKDPSQALFAAWQFMGGLIVAAVVGGLVILAMRRRLLAKNRGAADETLVQTLRRMRDTGELSHEEYEASVRSIAQRAAHRGELSSASQPGPRAPSASPELRPRPTAGAQAKASAQTSVRAPSPPAAPAEPAQPFQPSDQPSRADDFPPLIELPPDEPGDQT